MSSAISCRVRVSGSCAPVFAGDAEATDASPLAHPEPDALALARLVIGSPVLPGAAECWDRGIPAGRHTVWCEPVTEAE